MILKGSAQVVEDVFQLDMSLLQWRRGVCRTHGVATLADGALVASADVTTVVREST